MAFAASLYVCLLQNDGQPSSMLDRDWGGGSKPTPQTQIFSHQCGGHLQPVGGLNPPTPRQIERCLGVDSGASLIVHYCGDCRCEVSLQSYSPSNVGVGIGNANFWGFWVIFLWDRDLLTFGVRY